MSEQPKKIGKYEIVELVGRGGMGVLYRARDPHLERDIALKMMLVDFSAEPGMKERFTREARAAAKLQHRNVVTIHELGESEGAPYIAMEFLGGCDLTVRMRREPWLTLDEKLDIMIQLCAGLSFAHEQGIVHRDVKPGNVRVLEDGTVKILDFGIAKVAMTGTTQRGDILGSANYMAPEQIAGERVDGRADIFSTGVILYELLSGRRPFAGDSPTAVVYQIMHQDPPPIRTIVPDLPEELEQIIDRALKKLPDDRYSRASEMASDLQVVRSLMAAPIGTAQTGTFAAAAIGDTLAESTVSGRVTGSGQFRAAPPRAQPPKSSPGVVLAPPPPQAWKYVAIAGATLVALTIVVMIARPFGGKSSEPIQTRETGGTAEKGAGPATTTTAAATAVLNIGSVPAGARIFLDGADTGKLTPAAVAVPGPLPKQLRLTLQGHLPFQVDLQEADVKAGSREYKLVRESTDPVVVTITGSYPFEVLLGNRVLSASATQHDVKVPSGERIRLRNAEYFLNTTVSVDARSGRRASLEAPGLGTLAIFAANETCDVSIDGQGAGNPPIPRQQVAAGSHTVSLKCPDGADQTRKVTVTEGVREVVTFR